VDAVARDSGSGRCTQVKAPARALLIPAALLAAGLISRALLTRAPARLAVDFAQPLVIVTDWNAFGAALLAVLAAALVGAGVVYWSIVRSPGDLSIAGIVAVTTAALAAAWYMPVLFSSDVYAYAAYGELSRLGANPYAHVTLARGNAIFDAAIWQWGNPLPVCVYGPAFVALARAIVTLAAPLGTLASLQGMRVLASAALPACAFLAYHAYPGDRAQRSRAAATIGLNPVAVWCAAEGHNDALALAVALGGFVLARRGWLGVGAATVALSAAVKSPAAAGAVALAITNARARAGAIAGLAIAAALSWPLVSGIAEHLVPNGHYAPYASLQAVLGPIVAPAVAVALAANAIARLHRGSIDGWSWLALGGWALLPNPYPWYGLWLIAVAALAPRSRAGGVAIALSFTSLLRYAPDAIGAPNPLAAIALGIGASSPFLALVMRPRHRG
jgi:hypothetical protein